MYSGGRQLLVAAAAALLLLLLLLLPAAHQPTANHPKPNCLDPLDSHLSNTTAGFPNPPTLPSPQHSKLILFIEVESTAVITIVQAA
jgi:hypothetical protein